MQTCNMATARVTTLWLLMTWLVAYTSAQARSLTYQIEEELPPNTLIGNIPLDARMDSAFNMTVLGKLRFSFLTMPAEVTEDMFTVKDRSGLLQTVGRVDRDIVCPSKPLCELTFDIAVRPAKYFQIVKVKINISDINDNHPKFPQPRIVHEISESALPGTSFSIPSAEDPDSGINSVQHYKLVSDQEKFQLKVRETADGAIDLRLVLMGKLDREREDFYQVKIVASDGGKPSKSGSVLIDVLVLDANDNDPAFDSNSYEVTVMENGPVGSPVMKVAAHDPDQGLNGKIEYAFSRRTEQDYGELFGIDSETGVIFVKAELDYEAAHIYLLTVTAQDRGPDSLPAQANVVVRVEDVNDNAPEITMNTLTTTGDAHVTENTPPGAFVAHISVSDGDSGENGKVICSIDNDKFLLQTLYSTEFKMVTASTFDRERQPYFDLRMRCMDNGNPPLSSFSHIRVTVVDENDHAPEFSQQFYSGTFTENNHIDEFILAVTATDLDMGKNGWVEYSVADDAQNVVKIDPETGWITANVIFDHEQIQELRFHVLAKDRGEEARSSTATILITVLDVDDEKPEFQQNSYRFGTFENQPAGSEVGQVIATDKDSDPYNYFTYRLDHSRSATDIFEIDPYDGRIRTRHVLDREDRPVYYLVAIAQGDASSKSSTTSISIYVADKNDNAPEFYFPNARNNTIHVSSQVPTGHVITRLQATDRDTGKNAKLTFYFQDGNKEEYFTLDRTTGSLKVNRDLTKFKHKSFTLHIRVEDEGEPQLSSLAELQVVVNNALGYPQPSTGVNISRDNLIILIVFGAATLIISTIIIATIIVIRRKDRQEVEEQDEGKKTGEMEKMLNAEDPSSNKRPPPFNSTTSNKRYVTTNDIGKLKQNSSADNSSAFNPNSNERTDTLGKNTLKAVPGSRQAVLNEQPHLVPGHEDSDSGSSAVSNSDSGRGPSSEEDDLHPKLGQGQRVVRDPRVPATAKEGPDPVCGRYGPPVLGGGRISGSRPDLVCKTPSSLTPSSSMSAVTCPGQPIGYGELHPHNLIRASPDQESGLQRLRGSQDHLHSGYSTLPLSRRTPSGRASPMLPMYPEQDKHAFMMHPLTRGHSSSLQGGSSLLPEKELVAYFCDPTVRDDRTTNV